MLVSGKLHIGGVPTMGAAMEQASTNAGIIGSAAEQMATALNEIAENSVKGRAITDNAVP